jgi:hypothetical protein
MGGFAPKGHARVNPQSPRAFAICDRCGFLYNHSSLRSDVQWRGRQLQKTGFLVCNTCWDVPNPTLRPISLPPDPMPIRNPRSEPVHCHTFKPRADLEAPIHSPETRYGRADIKWDNYPGIDHFRDVTVDSGSVCDTRTFKPFPTPPTPIPEPPIPPVDATADNADATADTTTTTADAYKPYVPLTGFFAVADTTQVTADNMANGTDSFPDYLYAADQDTETADGMTPTGDSQQL